MSVSGSIFDFRFCSCFRLGLGASRKAKRKEQTWMTRMIHPVYGSKQNREDGYRMMIYATAELFQKVKKPLVISKFFCI